MKKSIYTNLLPYYFDPDHRGAHYTFDNGTTHCNSGEFGEIQYKHCRGYEAKKSANTPFDAGSDIEEISASIKSSKATLTSESLGCDLQTSLDCYFERVASTCWIWVVLMDGTLTAYEMNADEFREFCEEWSNYQIDRRNVRFKATSAKMLAWLEERV